MRKRLMPIPAEPLPSMLSYKEYDNAQAVEIVLKGRVSTEEFDSVANRLEAFIARHGQVRVLEIVEDFEGMDATALWHDIKFSLRHLKDFSRVAVVAHPDTHHLWSALAAPLMSCTVEHFAPGEEDAARDWLMWPEGSADEL
ncbi:MAG TPA: STAS/SEC14 domain-containing protein [Methyloceanibacter sp.]|jgi:hypothetical protein|nr:STAS/SEC14 domain-containing protein [Methyloceanibacter sp.]